MIQCADCQHFTRNRETGQISMTCDPFSDMISPDCLLKWQLLRLEGTFRTLQKIWGFYEQSAPMQTKMFKFMEKEMDEQNEAEKWKQPEEEDDYGDGYSDDYTDDHEE